MSSEHSHEHSYPSPTPSLRGAVFSPGTSPILSLTVATGLATATADPVADFSRDLAHSHHPDLLALFHSAYRRAFGAEIVLERVHDRSRQRRGIDVLLHFPDGSSLALDEKVRRLPRHLQRPWDDFFAEEYSDFERKTPGWLLADHHSDFIAYAAPLSVPGNADTTDDTPGFRWRIRLLDAPRLRETARREHERWAERYGRKLALNRGRNTQRNPGYATSAIPIPWRETEPFLFWQGDF
jgi:hypothetical protein